MSLMIVVISSYSFSGVSHDCTFACINQINVAVINADSIIGINICDRLIKMVPRNGIVIQNH